MKLYYIEKPVKWTKHKFFCLQWYPSKPNVFEGFNISTQLFTDDHWFGIYFTLLGNILKFDIGWTKNRDHAGFDLNMEIFGQAVYFKIYDHRHWDDDNNCWEKYE